MIAATARHEDEVPSLIEAGADTALSFYAEAGAGFAEHVREVAAAKEKTGAERS